MRRVPAPRSIGVVLVLIVLAACSSQAASSSPAGSTAPNATPVPTPALIGALPKGFPSAFTDQRPEDLPRLSPADGGLKGHISGSLVAGALTATYTATWIENRVATAKIACGGKTYRNVFTVDDPTVTSQVTFPGWGTGTLLATRRAVVYGSSINGSSPPICEEQVGGTFTITFTAGPTPGILQGTWSETPAGAVTLVPKPVPSAKVSPSPSAAASAAR